MTSLNGKTALVTGGSKGIGRAIVRALANEGADVWALARDEERLNQLKQDIERVQTIVGDVSDPQSAPQALNRVHPQIVVLNAGVTPDMGPIHKLSWEQFTRAWDTDTHMAFAFGKEALLQPLAAGSVVVIVSSGAAIGGSPLSGGYAGAKRMQWLLAGYLQQEANALGLDIRFVALLPKQLVNATELGHKAVLTYAGLQGLTEQEFLARYNEQLTPEMVAQGVVDLITNPDYAKGTAYAVTPDGLEAM